MTVTVLSKYVLLPLLTSNRQDIQLKHDSVVGNSIISKAAVEATVSLVGAAYLQDRFEEGQVSLIDQLFIDGDAGAVAQCSFVPFSDPFDGELVLGEGHTCKQHGAASIHGGIVGTNHNTYFRY